MFKKVWIIAALLMLMPVAAMAEAIEGKLNSVSLNQEKIEVNGVVYDVVTESTRIIYQGEQLSEEDLRPGDDVRLIFGEQGGGQGKQVLEAVILIRGSKSGLES